MIGSVLYAYVLGAICQLVAAMNKSSLEYRETMEELHEFMTERRLPVDMRIRLRGFFHHRRTMLKYQGHSRLLEAMSPGLRGEVAQYCNKQWIEKVIQKS